MEVDARSASSESYASTSCHSSGYSFNLIVFILLQIILKRTVSAKSTKIIKKRRIYRRNNQNTNTATTEPLLQQNKTLTAEQYLLRSNFHGNATTLDRAGLFQINVKTFPSKLSNISPCKRTLSNNLFANFTKNSPPPSRSHPIYPPLSTTILPHQLH